MSYFFVFDSVGGAIEERKNKGAELIEGRNIESNSGGARTLIGGGGGVYIHIFGFYVHIFGLKYRRFVVSAL